MLTFGVSECRLHACLQLAEAVSDGKQSKHVVIQCVYSEEHHILVRTYILPLFSTGDAVSGCQIRSKPAAVGTSAHVLICVLAATWCGPC